MDETNAEDAVEQIVADLTDKDGLAEEWERLDGEVQQSMKSAWVTIIRESAE